MIEFVISILVYCGFFAGVFLARTVKEEIKPGRKYFIWFKWTVWILAAFYSLMTIDLNVAILLTIGTALAFWKKRSGQWTYAMIPIICMYAPVSVAALWFVYGIPSGSLMKKATYTLAATETKWFWAGFIVQICLFILKV